MPGQGFDIVITPAEVYVKQDGSPQSGAPRGFAGVGCIFCAAYLFFFTVIIDKHGRPGIWFQLKSAPEHSFGFYFWLLLFSVVIVICGYFLLIGVRLFFPGGEQLRCDKNTFTYSKIPFISFRGRWKRRSFPTAEVSELMYGIIKYGDSGKNTVDVYGLAFLAGGREYKVFAGLEAGDADDIVKKLRALGVDVIVNQDMSKLLHTEPEPASYPILPRL